MKRIKNRWDIEKNWQYIFPILGFLSLCFSAYLIANALSSFFETTFSEKALWITIILLTVVLYYILLKITLWIFDKLKNKWVTNYRWEMIAIFLVFAITGSTAAKLAKPLLELLQITPDNMNGFLYWTIRIVIILPIYQILLVCFGWLFGQFAFFWEFEKKMLSRFGIKLK
jgi:ABC-type transport system involved in cytochrome bd biosynthesis fused ATPase/permease subunit